jgi:hypothetical protein
MSIESGSIGLIYIIVPERIFFGITDGLIGACGLFISLAAPCSPQKGEMGETIMFHVATLTVRTRRLTSPFGTEELKQLHAVAHVASALKRAYTVCIYALHIQSGELS